MRCVTCPMVKPCRKGKCIWADYLAMLKKEE